MINRATYTHQPPLALPAARARPVTLQYGRGGGGRQHAAGKKERASICCTRAQASQACDAAPSAPLMRLIRQTKINACFQFALKNELHRIRRHQALLFKFAALSGHSA